MISKNDFVEEVESKLNISTLSPGAQEFWQALKEQKTKERPKFTENGKRILSFLIDNKDVLTWKSKDIADQMGIASRTVSGAVRKLVNDGYVVKVSTDPVIYGLSDLGKNVEFNEENGKFYHYCGFDL